MTNLTILPADIYVVINKTVLNEADRKLVTMLYQPIIGYTAVSLYFTLIDDLDKKEIMSEDYTHHHLMSTMQLKLSDIVIAREKLEAVGLIKTYFKKDHVNNYVYLLYAPLGAAEFLNQPILNVVLYNNLGKKEYDKLVNYFKIPRINLKEFEDITSSFHEVFTSVPGNVLTENDNIIKHSQNSITLESKIDFDLLIASIPKNMVNERCFSADVKDLINNLSFVYNIDDLHMQGLVRNNLNEKGLIDKLEFRKSCRNFYQFEENGKLPTLVYGTQPEYLKSPMGDTSKWAKMVYTFETLTPYDYLRGMYKTGEPSSRDLKLIESLLVDLKLKPGVVNVLISYILKINNQKLNKAYVETIAGQWKRLNIETVEDAMRISEKEHKKLKRQFEKKTSQAPTTYQNKQHKQEHLPDWFDAEIKEQAPDEASKKELDEMLKQFS
ncbi:MAG: DnaD domain protein [Bacilli bacterium]